MKPWIKGGLIALCIHALLLVYFYAQSWCGMSSASEAVCAWHMRVSEFIFIKMLGNNDYRLMALALILSFAGSFTIGSLVAEGIRRLRRKG